MGDLGGDLVKLFNGAHCTVCATLRVHKILESAAAGDLTKRREIARCMEHMNILSKEGSMYLNNEKFRSEGKFRIGGKKGKIKKIWAFKAYQTRIYGAYMGNKRFICAEVDLLKKQDKVKKSVLESTVNRLTPYMGGR